MRVPEDRLWYLSQINLFSEMPKADLERIGAKAPMSTARKGDLIITPDREGQALYLLKEGRVRLFRLSPEGKEFTLAVLGSGNVFGEIETFSAGSRGVYAQAMEDCFLCVILKHDLEELLRARPELGVKMLRILTERLREAGELLERLAHGGIRQRLVHLLLKLAEKFGVEEGKFTRIDLNLTHQELASMIGSTRETVTANLSSLTRDGVVETGRKEILIDRQKAAALMEP